MNKFILKKTIRFQLLFIAILFINYSFAQSSNLGIFFQAVARDNYSNPAKDRKIYVQSSIVQSSPTGTVALSELYQTNTDGAGIFGISIGQGKRISGLYNDLINIPWGNGPFYLNLKIAIEPVAPMPNWNYINNWIDLGTSPFGTVPYALYANSVVGFDTKLNVGDTAKMLTPYVRNTILNSLLLNKLNLADSIVAYVTPTQLSSGLAINSANTNANTNAISLLNTRVATNTASISSNSTTIGQINSALTNKLNVADSIVAYVTPTQLSSGLAINSANTNANTNAISLLNTRVATNTASITSNSTSIGQINSTLTNKLNFSDSTIKYVTPSQLNNAILNIPIPSFDTVSLSNRINSKANSSALTSLSNLVTSNTSAIALLNSNVASNTVSITSISNATNLLNTQVVSNTAGISSNTSSIGLLNSTLTNKLNFADSIVTYITPTQLNNAILNIPVTSFDTVSLSNRINLKSNLSDLNSLSTIVSSNTNAIGSLNSNIVSNTVSITSNTNAIDLLNTRVASNTASITSSLNANLLNIPNLTSVGTITSGTWSGTTISVAKGGTGVNSLTGYVKGNGINSMNAVTSIPSTDITGLITKVNGTLPDQNGNVSISFGRVSSGDLNSRPSNGTGTNGDIYVVSGDVTNTNNGRTFIYDGAVWNEITSNLAATDARYLQLAGGVLAGNLVIPSNSRLTLTDLPSNGTDAVNKNYVDAYISASTIPDATINLKGKLQLSGDLAGTANSPLVATVGGSSATDINAATILANGATNTNTANKLVKRDALGNFSANIITADLTGNATTASLAGNISATSNTTLTSLQNLAYVGTITNGTWNGNTISVANGGTGATSLTGYLKGNGINSFSAVNSIPSTDVTGLIKKVNGILPDQSGNVSISFGRVSSGILSSRPSNGSGTNGDFYVVSGDATSTNNGRTFIYDGVNWNEITSNISATDARYLQLAGGSLSGDLIIPTNKKISLTDLPLIGTDAANKNYVDASVAASTNSATSSNNSNTIVKRDGSGNFIAGTITANLIGNASSANSANTATTAGNITATSNTTLTSLQNLNTVGTISTGVWSGTTIAVANGGTGSTNGSIAGTSALSFTAGGTNQNVNLSPSGTGKVVLNGNVGIGTASPNSSAALDVSSTTQMFYPPRMTTAQRDLISSPSTGGVIYNTTLNKLQVYTASSLNTDGTGSYSNSAVYDDPFQGQTIQPLYSGPLSSIKANVSIRGASDYIQVKIYDAPNGNLLATSDATFYAPVGGTFNFVTGTWTFANSNLIFNANSTYYIEFNAIGGNRFFIGETNNTYSRGQLYKGSTHAGVTAFSSYDIDCAVSYGNPGAWDANVTATKLNTSRNINGVAFDGSSDITIAAASNTLTGTTLAPNVVNSSLTSVGTLTNLTVTNPIAGSVTGNAGTATALASGRTIGITGDLTYTSPSFDGTSNVTAIATLSNSGVISGTYGSSSAIPSLTIDSKGRITNATTTSLIAGVNTVASIAGISNASGATISGTTITLTPADGINGGVLTNGAQTIAGAKTFSGAGTFSSTLSAGATTLASATITANETVGGTLAVTGATSLSNLTVSGTSTLTGSVVHGGLTTLNGNTSITGSNTLTVGTGATNLGGTLAVSGAGTFSSTLSAGATTLASATITANETVGGTLAVTGATSLSNLTVSGTSTLTGNVVHGGLTTLNGNTSISGSNTLTVGTGATNLGGTLAVSGAGTFSSTLSAGASTLASASITANETVGGTLAVTGATSLSSLTVSGTSTLTGSVAIGNLGAYASGDNLVLADANGNLHKRSITPVNTQASATSYTLSLGDNGGILTFASSSAISVTVPSTLPAGFVCQIIQKGTGQITITGSGITLNSANGAKSRAQYSAIGVVLETSTQGYITGDTIN